MSTSILVGYATRYGSTQEVAEAVTATLRDGGLTVDIQPMQEVIRSQRTTRLCRALHFLSPHREALTERPVAIFALCPTHDPYDKEEWQNSRVQLDQELAKFPWLRPAALEMFGGKYDPAKLTFPINLLAGKVPGKRHP